MLLTIFSAAVLTGQDFSPPAGQLQFDDVEDIVITGTRTPVKASEFTSAVSILTADDLRARQIFRVADALKALPGVALAGGGSFGGLTELRLRGGEANHVLVLIDGVEANDPAAGDGFQFESLSVTDIERIELIRGPQSSAWGSDALAGVINIVTRRGEGDATGSVRVEGGSFGTYRAGASVRAGGDGWHGSLGLDYSDTDGVNVSRAGEEDDGFETLTVNARGGVSLSDALSLDASLRYEDSRSDFDSVSFLTGLPEDSDTVTETEKLYSGLTLTAEVIEGVWTQQARLTYLDTEVANTADGAPDGTTRAEVWTVYSDTRITLDEDHSLTFFIDHEDTEFSQRGPVFSFGDPNQDQDFTVTGYGARYQGELVGGLTATASIRRDDNSDFGDITTWSAGLSARIPPTGTRFFAGIARGQRAPTVVERFGFFTNFQGNPDLEPERSRQIEVGFEQRFGDALALSVTGFWARVSREINGFVFDPDTFRFTAENIEGRSVRRGLEATLDVKLSPILGLSGHYSLTRSREPGPFDERRKELRRPEHSAFLGLVYTPLPEFRLALDLDYTGAAVDQFFPPFPEPSQRVRLDNYLLVRLAASYQVSNAISLDLRAENLLDETYEDIFGFNTPGLGAYAGLRFQF